MSVQDVDAPGVTEGELLLRVGASAICGTDLRTIEDGHRKLRPGQRIVLGHEFAGSVESAPGLDGLFPPGTRVAVAPNVGCGQCEQCIQGRANMCPNYNAFGITWDGAHTEYVRVPHVAISQGNVVPLPERTTFVEGALIEPLACVVNGNREARIAVGEEIDGRGCDVVITACSSASVQEESIGLLAPYGRVCLFGGLSQEASEVSLDTDAIHYKNLLVTGVTGGSLYDFRIAARLIASKRVDVTRIISHVHPLSDMKLAFEQAMRREAMKVVIQSAKGRSGFGRQDRESGEQSR
jgi:threonine dehydrogenase-like Zn-dependent dehydrogenase